MIRKRCAHLSLIGKESFEAALAAREAALGLTIAPPEVAALAETTGLDVADVQAIEPEPPATQHVDAWGNAIMSGPRLNGAYVIRHWLGNRQVYVCGAPEQHVRAGYWRRDGRMDGNGQGWICTNCHTVEAGLYGIFEREERR